VESSLAVKEKGQNQAGQKGKEKLSAWGAFALFAKKGTKA